MNQLSQKIIEKIKKDKPIAFETFMDMVLYHPELGYYTSQIQRLGKEGDFYTSSHLHPVFGKMIGMQIEEMWETMGWPSDFRIIEMGAGAGYLCNDMLEYLKKRDIFNSLTYTIVEINPFVIEAQKKMLAEYAHKVKWVLSLKGLQKIKGCIFSNELLDAFPVHLIEMDEMIKEIYIDQEDGRFVEIKRDIDNNSIKQYLKEFSIELPKGYRTEMNLRIKDWLNEINSLLTEGFIFTIDYGYPSWDYYSEERNRGTLLCYHKHQVTEDPLQNIGEQDITAHVNFSSVKKWGEEMGIKTIGFCQQGTFLISLGIDKEIANLFESSKDYVFEAARIKKLILPGTMGETHKVLIQYKGNGNPKLKGFQIKNQKNSL